jgi:hypothetical protein
MSTASYPSQDRALVGTKYRTYKRATDKLATWLASKALCLGVETLKPTESYTLSIAQFSSLTDRVVNALPIIEVPPEIVEAAHKAYSFRQETAALLRGIDIESDERHQHAINTIGEVFGKLTRHHNASKHLSKTEDFKLREEDNVKEELKVKKEAVPSFQLLELESIASGCESSSDSEGKSEDIKARVKINKSKQKKLRKHKKKLRKQGKQTELQKDEEDPYFVLICLLSDLKSMRDYIKEIWREYREGKVDLVTVSLTTNAAFDIIRTYEDDFPAISSLLADYSRTLKLMLSRNLDQTDKGLAFFFAPSTDIARLKKEELRAVAETLARIPDVACLTFANAYYFLNGPRHLIVRRQKGKMVNVIKDEEPFGKYRPDQNRRELSPVQQFEEDIQILTDFARKVYTNEKFEPATYDHFTNQWVHEFAKTGDKTITLAQVFGAQIYLDIHHTLRQDAKNGLQDLYEDTMEICLTIPETSQHFKLDINDNSQAFKDLQNDLTAVMQATGSVFLKMVVIDMPIIDGARRCKGNKCCQELPKHFPFLAINPLLCGTLVFQWVSGARDVAVDLAWYYKSIESAGQIYYSCQVQREVWASKVKGQVEGFSPLQWDDMDFLFKLYGRDVFFDGKLPKTNQDFVDHFGTPKKVLSLVSMWNKWDKSYPKDGKIYSVQKDVPALSQEGSKRPEFAQNITSYKSIQVTHCLYFHKYIRNDLKKYYTNDWTLETLQALLENHLDTKKVDLHKKKGKGSFSSSKTSISEIEGDISQVSILRTLKEALHSESTALRFDFLSFHMGCFDLLRNLRKFNRDMFDDVRMALHLV